MTRISVIVPIYNVIRYIRPCVESILSQTYQDLEVILVDDGSTDGCHEICEEYKRKDPRVVVVHKENGGLVSARKAGLRAASGEYIAYVDGDDWIEPDMYARMMQVLTEKKVDVVLCGHYEDIGENRKKVRHSVPEGRYGKEVLLKSVYPHMIVGEKFFEWQVSPGLWDKLFRRECVERFQLAVDERVVMGEDAVCTYPCLLHVDSIYVMRDCLYHYRQTTSSMVKRLQDYEQERKQFGILYETGRRSFERAAHIYDVREQWRRYVLFLMIPRADGLYRGFEELPYLFPFPGVRRGFKIVLYGAGTYGQRLFGWLQKTGFCAVAAWVDRNYESFQKMGLAVQSPAVIPDTRYDAIVVANTYERSRRALYEELIQSYEREKIHMIDEGLIFSEETERAFGLPRESAEAWSAGEDRTDGWSKGTKQVLGPSKEREGAIGLLKGTKQNPGLPKEQV